MDRIYAVNLVQSCNSGEAEALSPSEAEGEFENFYEAAADKEHVMEASRAVSLVVTRKCSARF